MVPMAAGGGGGGGGKRPYGHMMNSGGDPGPSSAELNSKRYQSASFTRRNHNHSHNHSFNYSFNPNTQQQQEYLFRILCPEVKIGGVIGKGGSIIKALRQQTGAKIRIDDVIPGSDERVIVIGEFDGGEDDGDSSSSGGAGATTVERDDRGVDEYTQGREVACSAQLALFKLHMRILDAERYNEEGEECEYEEEEGEDEYKEKVVLRMLVPENQVGCLLGKRGRIIEQMRDETGSQIRVLPREQLPACALASDEVVQVVGERVAVKRALNAISTRLLDNPPKDRDRPPANSSSFQPSLGNANANANANNTNNNRAVLHSNSDSFLQQHTVKSRLARNEEAGYQLLRPTAPGLSEFGAGRHMVPTDEELVFRVLCPNDKIGTIIGKAGTVIQTLREETGAKIKVADPVPGSEERVIIVSAVECPDEDLSPAQEAVFHIQDRMREGPEAESVVTRLLVPSNQVGCLLGKGGTIITEMRKLTRANIRVLAKEQLPVCALENDEVVQVIGEIRLARDALVRITSRLRANLYREKSDSRVEDFAYQRSTSPGGYPAYGLQGSQSSGLQDPRNPNPWNDRGLSSLASSLSGFGGNFNMGAAARSALTGSLATQSVVTCTRIEVLLPEAAVPAVVGVNGDNLAQISKLSGARVNLVDGYGGSGAERIIELAGTPDQTNMAKSLVETLLNGKLNK